MKKSTFLLAVAGLTTVAAALGFAPARSPAPAATSALAAAQPTTFTLDPVHSGVVFRISHLGVAPFYGRFNGIEGEFALDPENPGSGSVSITVDAATVDTGNKGRDDHLRSGDFFNVAQFPQITFRSTKIEGGADGKFKVTGDLSLHGVKKSVTVDVAKTGEKDVGARFGYRAGFEAVFTIRRTDYDMGYMVDNGMLGNEVKMFIAVEGVRK